MNAITKHEGGALALQESELLQVLQSSLYPGAALASIKMVLGYCKAAGLDPMQKPVHIVPMWDAKAGQMRDVVMPGVGLYRTQAARTGRFAGQSESEFGPMIDANMGGVQISYPEWARVTVRKQMDNGAIAEFVAKEYWVENYAVKGGKEKSIAPNAMWLKRPRGQIAKCAAAQALRLAFPEMGAQPTADEMEGKELQAYEPPTAPMVERVEPPTWPAEAFATQLPRWTRAVAGGMKTAADILALARSKGALTDEQEAAIAALKLAPVEPAAEVDPFVAEMDAAEREGVAS